MRYILLKNPLSNPSWEFLATPLTKGYNFAIRNYLDRKWFELASGEASKESDGRLLFAVNRAVKAGDDVTLVDDVIDGFLLQRKLEDEIFHLFSFVKILTQASTTTLIWNIKMY